MSIPAAAIALLAGSGMAWASSLSDQAIDQLHRWNEHPGQICRAMTAKLVRNLYGEGEDSTKAARKNCIRSSRREKPKPFEVVRTRENEATQQVSVTVRDPDGMATIVMRLRNDKWIVTAIRLPRLA